MEHFIQSDACQSFIKAATESSLVDVGRFHSFLFCLHEPTAASLHHLVKTELETE